MPERPAILASLAVGLTLAACGGGGRAATGSGTGTPAVRLPPPSRLDAVFILESSGVQPEDTVVTVASGEARTIIVRRGAPDNSLFAKLAFPAGALSPPLGRDSVRVTIKPRPGVYGLTIGTDGGLQPGATVTFSYGVHFAAPSGARERYGGDLGFERVLLIGQVEPDGQVVFLASRRPGSDLLEATLPGPGAFVVAAPR